jgi:cell division protein FtsB
MSLGTLARARNASGAGRRVPARVGFSLAVAAYAGISVYCALSLLLGPAGLLAYTRLEERKGAMEANLDALGSKRTSLSDELESLKTDPDRAAREARSLGYLRKGETALILGVKKEAIRPIDVGVVLPYAEPASLGDLALKEISLGACLAVMALLLGPRGKALRSKVQR